MSDGNNGARRNNINEFVDLGAAWLNRDREGRPFLSTSLHFSGRKVLLLKNRFKREGSQEPDYRIVLAPLPDDKRQQNGVDIDGSVERFDDDFTDQDPAPVAPHEDSAPALAVGDIIETMPPPGWRYQTGNHPRKAGAKIYKLTEWVGVDRNGRTNRPPETRTPLPPRPAGPAMGNTPDMEDELEDPFAE